MTRLLELKQLEYDMLESGTELSDKQYRDLIGECIVAEYNSVLYWEDVYLKNLWVQLVKLIRIQEDHIGIVVGRRGGVYKIVPTT